MTVYNMKRTDEDKHFIWLYLVVILTSVKIASLLTISMYYDCKKISARMSLRLTKTVAKQ